MKNDIGKKKIQFVNKAVQTRGFDLGANENKQHTCRMRGIEHNSEEDIGIDSTWIG